MQGFFRLQPRDLSKNRKNKFEVAVREKNIFTIFDLGSKFVISGGELPNVLAKVAESTGKMGSILIRLRSNNAGGKNTNSRHKICLE